MGRKYFNSTSWSSSFHSSLNSGAIGFKSRAQDRPLELICCIIQCFQEHAVFVPELTVGLFCWRPFTCIVSYEKNVILLRLRTLSGVKRKRKKKLFLCALLRHIVEWIYSFTHSLNRHCMECVPSFKLRLLYLQIYTCKHATITKLGGSQLKCGRNGEEVNLLLLPRIQPQILDCPFVNLFVIPTTLARYAIK
jgi:hypothetical protein